MKKFALLLFVVSLAFAPSGCQQSPSSTPIPPAATSPPPVEISVPTATVMSIPPTATAVPTAVPTDTPSPSETPPAVEPEAGATRVWEKDGAVMVYVPAGMFVMGSREDNPEADGDEYPQHDVILDGFWIDRTEVTNGRYEQCVASGGCDPPYEAGSYSRDSYYGDSQFANYPMVWVSWLDAVHYCEWAGKRLPTEAEWEKAARGTDVREYPWGNSPSDETLANYGDNIGDTTEVGKYSPQGDSPYGCVDMAGNVLEWVSDWYSDDYSSIASSAPVENPTGSAGPTYLMARVARGGSWLYPARRARVPFRVDRKPELREGNIGFRCVFSY